MTPQDVSVVYWIQAARLLLMFAMVVSFTVGVSLNLLAKRYGWSYVRKTVPAITVAVLLIVLVVAERRGWLEMPVPSSQAMREPIYQPYCGNPWSSFFNVLCW